MTPRRRLSAFDECDCDRPDQLEHRPATEENRLAALNAPQAIPGTGAIGGSVRVGAAHGGAWPDPVDPSTAGLDVLGVRLILAGHPLVTAILACVAATVWLVLTYGVPASLLLTEAHDSVLGGVNGSWLLWIVATQSLSIAAAIVVPAWPSQAALLAPVAAGMWSVGVLIYLMVVTLIMLRWLTVPMTPATLGPPYWILMGATATSVLAGARYLALPPSCLSWEPPPTLSRASPMSCGPSARGGYRC